MSQLIQDTIAVVDLREQVRTQQFTQLACIDLIGFRTVTEQVVLEWITDEDALDTVEQLQIQPVGKARFFEGEDDPSLECCQIHFEFFYLRRALKDTRGAITP